MNDRFEDYDDDGDDGEADYDDLAIPAEMMNRWKEAEISIADDRIHVSVLHEAITILSSSIWWRFLSPKKKIARIAQTYSALLQMFEASDAVYSSE